MQPAIYILTNKQNGTLYVGVTTDLVRRVWQHRNGLLSGFASKYGCYRLVYFERFEIIDDAIAREKLLKGGSRQKKIDLIKSLNPQWRDLFAEICGVEKK